MHERTEKGKFVVKVNLFEIYIIANSYMSVSFRKTLIC